MSNPPKVLEKYKKEYVEMNNMYWNWNKTYSGMIELGILVFVTSFIFQNIQKLNDMFLRTLPVGYLALLGISILILYKIYRILKWYNLWILTTKDYTKPILHGIIHLISVSVILSINLKI